MRLFVAIPVPDDLRACLLPISRGLRGARWVRPEGMHITLYFVGETDRNQARDLDAELSSIRLPQFELDCRRLGYFERGSRIHSVWAGVEPHETLTYLQGRVEAAAVKAGFPYDKRKFKPHVTLGRLKNARDDDVGQWLADHDPVDAPTFTVERFTLYRSHLAREGSMYEPLVEYDLT